MPARERNNLLAFFAGVLAGIVLTLLARIVLPEVRVALAPGHPLGPDEDQPSTVPSPPGLPDSVPGNGTPDAPDDYPIKGNDRSGIYHQPGGFAYDRTIASTFFRTPEAAEQAGLRAAKA